MFVRPASCWRLTDRGRGMLIGAPLLGAVGVVGHYPELIVAGVAAAGALCIAGAMVAGAPQVAVRRRIEPGCVTRGEAATVSLRVSRRRRSRVDPDLVAIERCGSTFMSVPLATLRRSLETTAQYALPTVRRGVIGIGPLHIRRVDTFGLFSATSTHCEPDRILVYPRVHPLVGMPRGVMRGLDGMSDLVPSGTITFDRLRPYVRGDELRHVHWRTTARLGELMVREHLEDSVPNVVVVLDDRAAAYVEADDFEAAVDAAASVTAAMVALDLRPTLLTTIADKRGPIMDRLAEVALSDAPIPTGFADVMRRVSPGTIVLLTGSGPGAEEAITATSGSVSPETAVVIVQFAAGGACTEPIVSELSLRRALSIQVRDAYGFASAWARLHADPATRRGVA